MSLSYGHAITIHSNILPIIWNSALKEITNFLHVPLPVFPVRHMRTAKSHPSDLRDGLEPWVHAEVCNLISLPINQEGFDFDLVPTLPALPISKRANDNELCWTLTGFPFELDLSTWPILFDMPWWEELTRCGIR